MKTTPDWLPPERLLPQNESNQIRDRFCGFEGFADGKARNGMVQVFVLLTFLRVIRLGRRNIGK